jgi:hypothetical protein
VTTTATPLDLRRAETALKKLSPTSAGYKAALDAYNSVKAQLDAQVKTTAQASTAEAATTKAKSQAKSDKQDTALLTQLQSTLNEKYQTSVNLGQPDTTIKEQLDKVNTELQKKTTPPPAQQGATVAPGITVTPTTTKPSVANISAADLYKTSTPKKKTVVKSNNGTVTTASQAKVDAAHAQAEAALVAMNAGGQYAIQMGLINSDASLKALFYKDVYLPILNGKQPVTTGQFQADLINSTWYKTYDANTRQAQVAQYGDAATWTNKTVPSAQQIVKDQALAAGYNLTSDQLDTLTTYALNTAGGKAENITGLALTQLKRQIANTGKFNPTGGAAATGIANIKSTLADYGVAHLYSDEQIQGFQNKIEQGTLTLDSVTQMAKNNAKSAYGAFADQIDNGFSVKDIVSPYLNLYGKTLELDPNAQDISDPNFAKNLFSIDPKTGQQTAKPLWQYQVDLKKDPRWAYTDNARADLDSTGREVLKNLGLAY